jgi:hypothetical protein
LFEDGSEIPADVIIFAIGFVVTVQADHSDLRLTCPASEIRERPFARSAETKWRRNAHPSGASTRRPSSTDAGENLIYRICDMCQVSAAKLQISPCYSHR